MKKLYRSQRDKKLFGLCGGLAEYLNVDSTLLRVVLVITAFFSGGSVILLYVIASLVIPKEPIFGGPTINPSFNSYQAGFGAHAQPQPAQSNLDEMMKDIEKKAMQKEIEELRAKLAKYEKGDK